VKHAADEASNTVTQRLRALAPAFAHLPRWTRHLPGAALWVGVTVLFAAAAGLFWRTVDLGTEYKLVHKDVEFLESQAKDVKQLVDDMRDVKRNTNELKKWHDGLVCEAERDWARRHGRHVAPCVPEPEVEP
jgi:hypothetical protein